MTSPISVLLPAPLGPTSAVVVPAGAWNEIRGGRHVLLVLEVHVLERDVAIDLARRLAQQRPRRPPSRIVADLADAVEPGERFADLRADVGDLDQRGDHHADEEDVHDEIAERHGAGEDRAPAHDHDQHADAPTMTVENA
jgi:hypothetical protein